MTARFFRDAFRSAPAGLAVLGPNGTIVDVNPAVEKLSGFERGALVGQPFWTFIDPDDSTLDVWPDLVAGRTTSYAAERRFVGSGGRELVLGLTVVPIEGKGTLGGFIVHVDDRSEHRRAEAERQAAEDQFSSAFEFAPIGMALVNAEGQWLRVNPALCRLMERDEAELLHLNFQDVTHPDDLDADLALLQQLIDGEIPAYQLEKRYSRSDGSHVWVQLNVSVTRGTDGAPRYFIAQIQDISARKAAEHELESRSTIDALTGVATRAALLERLAQSTGPGRAGGATFALLFLDVDHFKAVNDEHGHAAGDELLVEVASRLQGAVRGTDLVARFGGDEFVVLTDLEHDDDVHVVLRRVQSVLNRPMRLAGGDIIDVHVSVGVEIGVPGVSPADLVASADASMYAQKRSRRVAV